MAKGMIIKLREFKMSPADIIKEHGLEPNGRVQQVIDTEVIRCMDPYIPVRTHALRMSVQANSSIGSGKIKQPGPYARRQYHENTGRLQSGLRSGQWFERMKTAHRQEILARAAQEAGGKAK